MFSCKQSEESKIKDVCSHYMHGREALRNDDSLELKSVTDTKLFRFIMLKEQYIKIIDAPTFRADLNISPTTVTINGNKAICKMSGEHYYYIYLTNDKGNWIVKGENNKYITQNEIDSLKAEIVKYKVFLKDKPARDSVMKVMNVFYEKVKNRFLNKRPDELEGFCDEPTISFIEKFLEYAKQRSGDRLMPKINEPDYTTANVVFKGKKVSFKFYLEDISVELEKIDDRYLVTGFNHVYSVDINQAMMQKKYIETLRALKLVKQGQYRDKAIN